LYPGWLLITVKGNKETSTKGKGTWGALGNQLQGSMNPPSVKSRRTGLILPATSCDNIYEMLTKNSLKTQLWGFILGNGHISTSSIELTHLDCVLPLPGYFRSLPLWWWWWWCVSRSVISDSLLPHGLQPTRLLCPWNFPGKNIGVGCPFLLQGIFQTQGSNPGLFHCRWTLYHWAFVPLLQPFLKNHLAYCHQERHMSSKSLLLEEIPDTMLSRVRGNQWKQTEITTRPHWVYVSAIIFSSSNTARGLSGFKALCGSPGPRGELLNSAIFPVICSILLCYSFCFWH